jgi:tetraacyldisaccharide 4'-kinase
MMDLFMTYAQKIIDIAEGKRPGKSFLYFLSLLYRGGTFLRNWAYDAHLLKSAAAPLPIISVGNIVAGGTGKTPFVKFLAKELEALNPVAILSRGYRSEAEKWGNTLKVKAATPVNACGDEPYWLAQQLPTAQIFVGKNRLQSAQMAFDAGAQLAILDDGMQHRRLKRDFEIVLISGDDPWGMGHFLPRGFLRDSPHRLKEADLVAVIGGEAKLELGDVPVVYFAKKTKVRLDGKKVAAFCAIARPGQFVKTVQEAGATVVKTHFKEDHATFLPSEVEKLAEGVDLAVCTEKDWVKLPAGLAAFPLACHLEITHNQAVWDEMLKKIHKRVKA